MWHFVKTREREYLSGIPARDLTDEEAAALTADQRAAIEASPLYVYRDDSAAANASAAADGQAETGSQRRATGVAGRDPKGGS